MLRKNGSREGTIICYEASFMRILSSCDNK